MYTFGVWNDGFEEREEVCRSYGLLLPEEKQCRDQGRLADIFCPILLYTGPLLSDPFYIDGCPIMLLVPDWL
jgi:hypothetical protein